MVVAVAGAAPVQTALDQDQREVHVIICVGFDSPGWTTGWIVFGVEGTCLSVLATYITEGGTEGGWALECIAGALGSLENLSSGRVEGVKGGRGRNGRKGSNRQCLKLEQEQQQRAPVVIHGRVDRTTKPAKTVGELAM